MSDIEQAICSHRNFCAALWHDGYDNVAYLVSGINDHVVLNTVCDDILGAIVDHPICPEGCARQTRRKLCMNKQT